MRDDAGPDGRPGITAGLVRRLIAEQAPQWAGLVIEPVEVDGWDNRTYRLGDDLSVRLPTADRYVAAVEKEDRWLPVLAPRLPVPVPRSLLTGRPGAGYPYPWSVRGWLPGRSAGVAAIADPPRFAAEVGEFLLALQAVEATGGPIAGEHCFHRGGELGWYDDETRRALAANADRLVATGLDVARAGAVWDAAVASRWHGSPVWFHGDIAVGNLLVERGRLAAVIDFGTCGVGDPACDLVLAWTFLSGDGRRQFARTVGQNAETWARARGWALWKALISLTGDEHESAGNLRLIGEVLADPVGG
jgi:aminoglycoside phosphotransferase (APT) family kinase protein